MTKPSLLLPESTVVEIVHKYTLFKHLSILITYESLYFLKLRFYIKPVLGNETGKVFCIICPKAFFVLENKLKKE